MNRHLLTLTAALTWVLLASPAFATPTDTCNTYNADVTPDGALVLYISGEWGNTKFDDGHWIGASYGFNDMFEVGASWRLTETEDFQQDPVFDAKFRFDLGNDEGCGMEGCEGCPGCANTTGVAVGADNINFDEDKNGSIVPYVVYTHDFKGLRAHAGYSFAEDNGAAFVGLDAMTGDATLLWDWTQIDNGDDWETAFGVHLPFAWFDDNWVFTTFLTFSSNDDYADTWTAEIAYWIP